MINNNATAKNAKECLVKCKAHDQCKFWDYGADHEEWKKFCRLRSSQGSGPVEAKGYSFGSKNCDMGTLEGIKCNFQSICLIFL